MAAKDKNEKEKTPSTKAGLMHKHNEIKEADADQTARTDKNQSIDDKLPRTSKSSTGKSGGHEGLH